MNFCFVLFELLSRLDVFDLTGMHKLEIRNLAIFTQVSSNQILSVELVVLQIVRDYNIEILSSILYVCLWHFFIILVDYRVYLSGLFSLKNHRNLIETAFEFGRP